MITTGHFTPSLTLKKEKTGKAIYYYFVTNHSHPFPASCRSLGLECCLLSVNFRREDSVAHYEQCFCHGFFKIIS